jgi:hypothetical protein
MAPDAPKSLQCEAEIDAFAALLAREGVKSYLEIGSKFGGSLWKVANALPVGSRVVSVDINVNGESLISTINRLKDAGYAAKLIVGDSTEPSTVFRTNLEAPFDAVFIDADHRPPAVWSDWRNYGPMARIVAFHDIGWFRTAAWTGKRIDVPQIWNEIKTAHRFEEIKLCPTGKNNGIGVLWRS